MADGVLHIDDLTVAADDPDAMLGDLSVRFVESVLEHARSDHGARRAEMTMHPSGLLFELMTFAGLFRAGARANVIERDLEALPPFAQFGAAAPLPPMPPALGGGRWVPEKGGTGEAWDAQLRARVAVRRADIRSVSKSVVFQHQLATHRRARAGLIDAFRTDETPLVAYYVFELSGGAQRRLPQPLRDMMAYLQ